jgi:hypothetical protein
MIRLRVAAPLAVSAGDIVTMVQEWTLQSTRGSGEQHVAAQIA